MENTISKEERLSVYKKTLQMYETGKFKEGWSTVGVKGLCQVLRAVYVDSEDYIGHYTFSDGTEWYYDDTPEYFPEFKAHWNRYSLNDEERIEVLKLCIKDLQVSEEHALQTMVDMEDDRLGTPESIDRQLGMHPDQQPIDPTYRHYKDEE